MEEINFGQYAIPVILMVILAFVYKLFDKADGTSYIPNRLKPLIAIMLGIGLGIVGMFYNNIEPNFKNFVDYILYGFMTGASGIGLWEGFKAVRPAGANGLVKIILIPILCAGLLVSGLSGCSGVQPNLKDNWPAMTEDEQSRFVIGAFQDAVPILFVSGKTFILAKPEYAPAWRTRIVPIFDQTNKLLFDLEALGSTGQKVTVHIVLNSVQPRIMDIMLIYTSWGNVIKGSDSKIGPDQYAFLIISAIQIGQIAWADVYSVAEGQIKTWDEIIAKNQLVQTMIDMEK